jgi:hypothetical protein
MTAKSVTTSKKKSKSGTANSSLNEVSSVLVADFSKVVGGSLPAEFKVFEKACQMLETKKVGIAGLKASIEKANEIGALPTIKPSHAQDFLNAKAIRSLAGGKDQSLKVLLNTAVQARRYFNGKDDKMNLGEALDFVEAFDDLEESIPSQGEQKKRKARTEGDKVEKALTLEQLLPLIGKELKRKPLLKGKAIADAEVVIGLLAQVLDRSKASPIKGIVTPAKGGAVIDIDKMTKRVKKVA